MDQIGIFGGTFNPIHWGHLLLAECARQQFNLNKVLFVASAKPPHRDDEQVDKEARHKMVEAAVSGNPFFAASRVELDRPGPSYMVDTLKSLAESYGSNTTLNLIIGYDNLLTLMDWHKVDELTRLCRILVAPRPAVSLEEMRQVANMVPNAQVEFIDFPLVAVSSTLIRKRLSEGKSVLYMVPAEVNKLLSDNGYYRSPVNN